MKNLLGLISIIAIFVSGCSTTLSSRGAKIQEVGFLIDDKDQCTFLGLVEGFSYTSKGSLLESLGWQNAKNKARNKAAELGATHIIFSSQGIGRHPRIEYRAYTCL